jgi:chorismate dehydratase
MQMEVLMYRFAVLPYCNAAPLVYYISDFCPSIKLLEKYPREMYDELKFNRVDAALVPIVDFLTNENLRMVPELGICADGPVESVLLRSQKPLDEIRSIRLFPESRTSNSLIQVLLFQCFGANHDIRFTTDDPEADATIMIGDQALQEGQTDYTYDLSDMWNRQTNLPFVFAVWAYQADIFDRTKISSILHKTKEKGCNNISVLSRHHAERLNLDPTYIQHYLTDCLYYDIGPREIESIKVFHELMVSISGDDSKVPILSMHLPGKKNDENL